MKKQEKVQEIHRILKELYPNPQPPLDHEDPFTLLIAVLLSAQSTDKKVNEITPSLFKLANTPQKMANLSVNEIRTKIKAIGLSNTKAKNIKKLSQILVEKYNSTVPQDIDILETLPGVGHKTASVVMSQAFGVATFPVDTHIHRLAYRWGLSNGKNVVQTEKDCKRLFPQEAWNDLHLQIIFFGREYCPARRHVQSACPICRWAGVASRLKKDSGTILSKH